MRRIGSVLLLASVALIDCSSSEDSGATDAGADTYEDPGVGCCTCTERPRNADCGTSGPDTGDGGVRDSADGDTPDGAD